MLVSVMFIIFASSTLVNLGYRLNISLITSFTIGIMMIVMGAYMKNIKQNWFMGIRTPWTLSNETVWNKTHLFGGKLFMGFGVSLMIITWLPARIALILFIIGIGSVTLGSFLYSYLIYKKELK
jgi:uncharacterized membrane protein